MRKGDSLLEVRSQRVLRVTVALVAGAVLAWLVGVAGPAGTVTAATTGAGTGFDSSTGAITRTETRTVTEPARTDTVTSTKTAEPPRNTTSVTNQTATVQLTPAATTAPAESSSSGLPAWAWVLIGLGAVLIGLVMFMAGRHRGRAPSGPAGTPRPPAPDPGTPG